jgi:hypothetical protein
LFEPLDGHRSSKTRKPFARQARASVPESKQQEGFMLDGRSKIRFSRRMLAVAAASGAVAFGGIASATIATASPAAPAAHKFSFSLTVAKDTKSCLPHASGRVTIVPTGVADTMTVSVSHVPGPANYALFDLQKPTKPFGVATFLTYLHAARNGQGTATVAGIFDSRTFSLSLGAFAPTREYHLGLWFTDPKLPFDLGCEKGATKPIVTPFDGTYNAGILVLGTAQFPANRGPLSHVHL